MTTTTTTTAKESQEEREKNMRNTVATLKMKRNLFPCIRVVWCVSFLFVSSFIFFLLIFALRRFIVAVVDESIQKIVEFVLSY